MTKILIVFGTRPEAIKLCPVVLELRKHAEFQVTVCVTGQHRSMLDQVLSAFGVQPEYDLDLMLPGQTLFQSTARIVAALEPVMRDVRPDLVLVQGDTTTTFCGALAAFYGHATVGHVEAGMRTWDVWQPFPEEMNRLLTTRLGTLHFAATGWAAENLRREGIAPEAIFVTGNTGIDAVLHVKRSLEDGSLRPETVPEVPQGRKLILVTAHRRESFGPGFERICSALLTLAEREDVQIIYPVHRNPNVMDPVNRLLNGHPRISLIEPLDYVSFVELMRRAYLLITDSGGVQEEGPSLGKPILVLREKTERPEAVEAGTVILTGTDPGRIVEEAVALLESPEAYQSMARVHNPYGDGNASAKIAAAIHTYYLCGEAR